MLMTQLNLGWEEKIILLYTNVLHILTDRFTNITDYKYYRLLTDRVFSVM